MSAVTPAIGHNNPPPHEVFAERLDLFAQAIADLGTITDATAQVARDQIAHGTKLAKEIDDTRDAEKRPHLEAGRAVDARFKPLVDRATALQRQVKQALQAFLTERERIAREAAEKARREAEEAAKAAAVTEEEDPFLAATADVVDVEGAAQAAKVAEMQAAAARRVTSASGDTKALGLKTKRVARVDDAGALAAHYAKRQHPELLALLQKLADAEIRHAKGALVELPGVTVIEERVL